MLKRDDASHNNHDTHIIHTTPPPAQHPGAWHKALQAVSQLGNHEALGKLGDFTTSPRVILISLWHTTRAMNCAGRDHAV